MIDPQSTYCENIEFRSEIFSKSIVEDGRLDKSATEQCVLVGAV